MSASDMQLHAGSGIARKRSGVVAHAVDLGHLAFTSVYTARVLSG
jgi:hypothetical protein